MPWGSQLFWRRTVPSARLASASGSEGSHFPEASLCLGTLPNTMAPPSQKTGQSTTPPPVGIAKGNKRVVVCYVTLMLAGSARTWLNSLPADSVNSWVDFEEAFIHNFTGTYKGPGRPRELPMCVQRPDEPLRDYVMRWTELRNS
ncbi:hypothetical protein ZWY2020_033306 [Hordeum vulgare]|nr:hypothetical protein ZWY2020_033306 [Hordeum vulgare]